MVFYYADTTLHKKLLTLTSTFAYPKEFGKTKRGFLNLYDVLLFLRCWLDTKDENYSVS